MIPVLPEHCRRQAIFLMYQTSQPPEPTSDWAMRPPQISEPLPVPLLLEMTQELREPSRQPTKALPMGTLLSMVPVRYQQRISPISLTQRFRWEQLPALWQQETTPELQEPSKPEQQQAGT